MPLSAIDNKEAKGFRERFLGLKIAEIKRNSDRKGISTEIFGHILSIFGLNLIGVDLS